MLIQYKYCFEVVYRILKDIRGSNALFGGILVILGGDFAQILLVVRRVNRARIIAANLQ